MLGWLQGRVAAKEKQFMAGRSQQSNKGKPQLFLPLVSYPRYLGQAALTQFVLVSLILALCHESIPVSHILDVATSEKPHP